MPIINTADIARSRNKYRLLNAAANHGNPVFVLSKVQTESDIMTADEHEANLSNYTRHRRTSINMAGDISSVVGGGMNRRNAIETPSSLSKTDVSRLQQTYKKKRTELKLKKPGIQTDSRARIYPTIVSKVMYGQTRRDNYGEAVWNQWPFNNVARFDSDIPEDYGDETEC